MDEELDGGTDYANNYFDNGEGYLDDDDDNLDEGGIYWQKALVSLSFRVEIVIHITVKS